MNSQHMVNTSVRARNLYTLWPRGPVRDPLSPNGHACSFGHLVMPSSRTSHEAFLRRWI